MSGEEARTGEGRGPTEVDRGLAWLWTGWAHVLLDGFVRDKAFVLASLVAQW